MPPNEAQLLRYVLPVIIILPLLYFRLRRTMKSQPLKISQLWIRPALYMVIAGVVLFAPLPAPRGTVAPHLTLADAPWLVLALLLGAGAGWQWGRVTRLHFHPENGTLMTTGGMVGMLVLLVLIVMKLGLRTGAADLHANTLLISDASILFSAALFAVRGLEIYLRARRMQAQQPVKRNGPWKG